MNGRGDVYMDTNTGQLSVVDRRTGSDTYGRVVDKRNAVVVRDADVIVSQTKRREAIREGIKNVHAKFRGTVESDQSIRRGRLGDRQRLYYDPTDPGCFITTDGDTVLSAEDVRILVEDGTPTIWATWVVTGTPDAVTSDLETSEVSS
jgi:hypothetical protein